ncbi:hypothetical protein BZG36_01524 [Bifiguratus adelaidae]|uniref:UBC core domain-containing protein n=1 Tax=Bifiguratus adelaidae TaxID=1938954 RepID=A0A261Y4U0_9FUNG|nr:hypothetical protein BZG36_01524 [Bifiguratus adelaidae]
MEYRRKSPAVKRIMQEASELQKDPSNDYTAAPLEENIFEWHFTLRGPVETEFEGGRYHGRILLPNEYPFKPPEVILLTPNGRFELNTKICLSITGYHPEFWQPAWGVRTVMLGLLGFFPTKSNGAIGGIDFTVKERKKLATLSRQWKCPTCNVDNLTLLPDATDEDPHGTPAEIDMPQFTLNYRKDTPESSPNASNATPDPSSDDTKQSQVPTTTTVAQNTEILSNPTVPSQIPVSLPPQPLPSSSPPSSTPPRGHSTRILDLMIVAVAALLMAFIENMTIKIVPLGAGQDVGRSCILVTVGGKNVMLDCGMHMSYNDERRFPDFTYISRTGQFNDVLDCVIISHFHLDHCGALPFFTEMCGYDGPLYMTAPTKTVAAYNLEDYRKIQVERKGDTNFFTSSMIKACLRKVTSVNLHETIHVDDELTICAYYAGHVLGAAMFYISANGESLVYTGDYNMTPDRHLGAAWIDKLRPDVLITESTYATTIRESKRARERDFLKKVQSCIDRGGKVLIPVFALGRAQELCILIESYWERHHLTVPVYSPVGMAATATQIYKQYISWTNEKIKDTFVDHNMFEFKHLKAWDRNLVDNPGPMVVFASPGMLNAGTALEIFKKWAPDPKNMIIMPGWCSPGTVGARVLKGEKQINVDAFTRIDVNLTVANLSFSAHADAKGIVNLIQQLEPKHVVLVHGEQHQMDYLKPKIYSELGIPCYNPPNGTTISIETSLDMDVDVEGALMKQWLLQGQEQHAHAHLSALRGEKRSCNELDLKVKVEDKQAVQGILDDTERSLAYLNKKQAIGTMYPLDGIPVQGIIMMDKDSRDQKPKIVSPEHLSEVLSLPQHDLIFSVDKPLDTQRLVQRAIASGILAEKEASLIQPDHINFGRYALDLLYLDLVHTLPHLLNQSKTSLSIKSITITPRNSTLLMTWHYRDETLALRILAAIARL